MTTFANQLKSEIARIAKKEARSETLQLKKASSQHRSDIAALKRHIAALEASLKKIKLIVELGHCGIRCKPIVDGQQGRHAVVQA